jgi:hypothetical protein
MTSMIDEDYEKHIYAIIRKPQEGKTFICLEEITQSPNHLHLIITMNTIKSNAQFFERGKRKFGDNICVFNSKKDTSSEESIHEKDVLSVKKRVIEGVDIVIMCAHKKRFDESMIDLINELTDSVKFTKQIKIHIDEAHEYFPPYRNKIIEINDLEIVERIHAYTATPFSMWSEDHQLFNKIYVIDIQEQYNIVNNGKYFGVKDVELQIITKPINNGKEIPFHIYQETPFDIPNYLLDIPCKSGALVSKSNTEWYREGYTYFSLGKELEFMGFIDYTLNYLKQTKKIINNKFSYNFVPGYTRKITHYGICDKILEHFPEAIVIVINSDGTRMFMLDIESNSFEISDLDNSINEPSEQIYNEVYLKYPNKPIFITGFICVSMSVTLINEKLGNFDNVIMSYPQFLNDTSVLYQLCRYLFNYTNWDNDNIANIKKTVIYSELAIYHQSCIEYEKQIDTIDKMSGSLRTLDEVKGNIPVKIKLVPKEKKNDQIAVYAKSEIKTFKVYPDSDNSPDIIWSKVYKFYEDFRGKKISDKSKPKYSDGVYKCSTTKKVQQYLCADLKSSIKNMKWDSNHALTKDTYKYARIYVAYESLDDPNEYNIYVKTMELEENSEVKAFLQENY